jgi:multiple sugar transport system substrate-binding protein
MTITAAIARRRARLLLLLAAVLLIVSCQPASKRTVVFWQSQAPEIIEPLIAKFEEEHPRIDVQVEQLGWSDTDRERITAAVASDSVPDLCEIGSTWMPRMLDTGALVDWSAGVADLKQTLRGWSMCSIGDAIYGMPWVLGTRVLFYNKALFARAGLDSSRAPETWDELYAAAAAIDRLGGVHGYGVQAPEPQVLFKKFMPFAWGNGGRVLSDDLGSSEFDSPRNVEALEFYLKLREVGLVEGQQALDRRFKDGKLGLQISGAWLFRSIARDAPRLRYGVALVPRPSREHGTHASFAGGELLVSFSASKNKEDALRLARFLVRPEQVLALAAAAGNVQPAAIGADTSAYYRARPNEQTMLRQFETAITAPNHPAWDEMESAIEDEVGQALRGKSAARAVADAHARIQVLARRR